MKLKSQDIETLNKLLEMEQGYVLDFSDKTINKYFEEELNIDFNDDVYRTEGGSKAKRLRCFLKLTDRNTVITVLSSLWNYKRNKLPDNINHQDESLYAQLLQRLQSVDYEAAQGIKPTMANVPTVDIEYFKYTLNNMWSLDPQTRGFKFETWLNELFNAYHLTPRPSFRITGEQIDGSFQLDQETYLVEAKWKKEVSGAADLHILEGKLGQKADWARGVFISYSGFSKDGLHAWGRAKRVICVSGEDLYIAFNNGIALPELLQAKIRRAAETGDSYTPTTELFVSRISKNSQAN
ncbi:MULTISPECIES: restriction endonuclease [Pectobacterium]|uniref:restriction endonuclease n=1 Tax=Pectobacterium TaxID=122277 RepID=UPI00196910DC|nr:MULTISPECIES: restriction endonuclease [Pectobacterium]QSD45981.1 restriction endonuclease [Pectobacterium brasiliense]